ncbi:hypothetical protein [Burkholderia sp. LMG 21824]|uniref:hypothetical protein n=1 Tax=Burkholderia sp. LMG 21824 TaxID=3158172 RepID=UPI003C2EF434
MNKSATRYRKVRPSMWGDQKFRELSIIAPSGQALWLYLLTGPHTSSIPGVQWISVLAMAEKLRWSSDDLRGCLAEISDLGMAQFDPDTGFLYLPHAIEYDPPSNPNVVRGWANAWAELPECDLKRAAYDALRAAVVERGESFEAAFDRAISKPGERPKRNGSANGSGNGSPNGSGNGMANQEQEQEQKTLKPKVKNKPMSISKSREPDSAAEAIDEVREIFEYWQLVMSSPRSRLDDNRRGLIRRAIAHGYTVPELKEAIRGCSRSPFHMGQNDRQTAFNGLDLILRNAEKIDEFRKIDAHPPTAMTIRNGVQPQRLTAAERRRLESDANMRDFLGIDDSAANGHARLKPDDPFTIDMDKPQ